MLLSITLLCFFSLLFVKVTLITDVIHVDISASSLGDTIVVFRDPYLFSDDIVSVFHRTTKQWLCKKNVELYFVLFTVKVWYKYKSTRSGWPNIANVFRLMDCNKCSEIYNSSVSTLYNLRGHKSFCVVYTEVIVKYQSTLILNICFISNLNSKHFNLTFKVHPVTKKYGFFLTVIHVYFKGVYEYIYPFFL